jgi:hypothetical protein
MISRREATAMSRFLEVDVGEHGIVLVEVVSTTGLEEGLVEVGAEKVIQEARGTFDNVLAVVKACALKFVGGLGDLEKLTGLDEASLEFGINLEVDVGAVIARASSEGNFKVILTWKSGASEGQRKR